MDQVIKWLKWRIAEWYNRRYPQMCWADLCMWVMFNTEFPRRTLSYMCKEDMAANGHCWCGKLKDKKVLKRLRAEWNEGMKQQ